MDFQTLMTVPAALLDGSRGLGAKFVAGVDGGATKTVAAVLDLETFEIRLGRSGPSNPDAVGADAAEAAVETALRAALAEAGIDGRALGATVFGIAGTPFESVGHRLGETFSLTTAYYTNDVITAWASGTWLDPGVAVISGTGSHVFGVNAEGESWRTGGWGHILGDEGSAYWLGLSAMKAALHFRDGSGPETLLLDAVTRHYGLEHVEDLQELFYGEPLTKGEVAAFARDVARLADAGDLVARSLFARAAQDLATQVRAPVTRLGLEQGPFTVALVGSVFAASLLLRDPFERLVLEFAPHALFVVPDLAPVAGALLLAIRAEGAWLRLERERIRTQLAADVLEEAPS